MTMALTLPAFPPLQASLWRTLCGRTLDNRSSHRILGDETADEIVRRTGYDYQALHIIPSAALNIAHRRPCACSPGWRPRARPGPGRATWCCTSASEGWTTANLRR
jgi:hypothetical protein